MQSILRVFAFIAFVLAGGTAFSHHNTGAYFDTDAEFVIDGVIDEVMWRNPHVYFTITGTSDSGETDTWRIEAGPTGIMRRFDWNRDTLQAGDPVTVTANPSRREGQKTGYLKSVVSTSKSYPAIRGEEQIGKLAVNNV